jgi:hypothetical protein
LRIRGQHASSCNRERKDASQESRKDRDDKIDRCDDISSE